VLARSTSSARLATFDITTRQKVAKRRHAIAATLTLEGRAAPHRLGPNEER